jgi:excisionase family DNA binding protein
MSFANPVHAASDQETDDRFLTVTEVAQRIGLSNTAVYREIHRGHLRAYNLCGRLRIPPEAVELWLAASAVTGTKPADPAPVAEPGRPPRRGRLRPLLESQRAT